MEKNLTESQERIIKNLVEGNEYSTDNLDMSILLINGFVCTYVTEENLTHYRLLLKAVQYYNRYIRQSGSDYIVLPPLNRLEQTISESVQRVEAAKREHQRDIQRREEEEISVGREKFLKATGLSEELILLLNASFVLIDKKQSLPVAMTFDLDNISYSVECRTNSNGLVYVNAASPDCKYEQQFFYFGSSVSFEDALLATTDEIRRLKVAAPLELTRFVQDEEVKKTAIACLLAMIQSGREDPLKAIQLAKEIHSLMDAEVQK